MPSDWVKAQVKLVGLDEIEIEGGNVKRMRIQLEFHTHGLHVNDDVEVLKVDGIETRVIDRTGRVLWEQNG